LSDSFTCSICGNEHQGLITDWAYALPDVVWAISEGERKEKARFNNDLCQFDDRSFIRCVLEVPFTDAEGYFGWGAWAEVEWPVFERYLELYDENGSSEPRAAGQLANDLCAYQGSIGMPVFIQFRDPSKRPLLILGESDGSLLAEEQRLGIGERRYHEIMDIIQHR
jgi:hypothetical protein